MRLFHLQFTRLGNSIPRPFAHMVRAVSVEAIQPEVLEIAKEHLGDGATVTVEPLSMKGQVNYGLGGNFDITDLGPA